MINSILLQNILQTQEQDPHFFELSKKLDRIDERQYFDIDKIYVNGLQLLTYCAQKNYYNTAKLLLKNGAGPNAGDFRINPIHCAAIYNHVDMMELLYSNGASLDTFDTDGNTSLYLSIFAGKKEAANWLLNQELDVNRTGSHMPPILEAASKGDLSLVEALVEKGADVGAINYLDESILEVAEGHPDITSYLLNTFEWVEEPIQAMGTLMDHGYISDSE